ncbi:type VII secretion protein EssC [Staphylococcus simulans]|uniref:type VII secretion protein EssC n=1 Tax=Staphylococcus simulans TaxID=1286 RepID=UPI000D09A88D|nr:type VII secretion protein EssC [Staphylococcus simulans]AVO03098.1 type VII secretion protein EssC [Staphylococcus simulans]AVO06053.1 type VII secretion protein EssC [Staphylococcus simulans]AWG19646.1 type VII secretion protein EssC [Staphylococcus simulans]AWI02595.1 type VII secretion protein EssC [Staphylococcus simulans]
MQKLIIKFNDQVRMVNLHSGQSYSIDHTSQADITLEKLEHPIIIKEHMTNKWNANEISLIPNRNLTIEEGNYQVQFELLESDHCYVFEYPDKAMLTIGCEDYDDIQAEGFHQTIILQNFKTIKETNTLTVVHNLKQPMYINYNLVERESIKVNIGDHLYIERLWIEIREDYLIVMSPYAIDSNLVEVDISNVQCSNEDYFDYHRSPRIIHREPTEPIKIEKPPQPVNKNSSMIWRAIIPPLVMIILTVVIYLIRPLGIYMLMMVGMSVVMIGFGISTYIRDKKRYNEDVRNRKQTYEKYLKEKSTQIHKTIQEQRFSLNFHYPTLLEIQGIIENKAPRIYEKTAHHHDFLHYKLGLANIEKSFKLDYQEDEYNQRRDELFDEAKHLYEHFGEVEQAPLINDLMHGPIAYIGPRHLVMEELQQMLLQIATFHSYHDVEFLIVLKEEEFEQFKWMRWLPHMNLSTQNVRGFVYQQRTRDLILTSIYSLIKERINTVREQDRNRERTLFSPHLVFVITDMSLIMDHVILEYVNQDLSDIGVSLVFVEDVIESLPEHVRTIIDIKSRTEGELIMKEEVLQNIKFIPESQKDIDKAYIARRLANLNHIEHMKNAIPESVTFMQMYNATKVNDLKVSQRWQSNETYKTMAVPLGVRGKDDVLELNLHERAHGPHGLIAGTTGSGKSEIIQSYILSLAVNFHPHEIAFLLIDYKGGGMANLFRELPHLVGTITNLDGDEAMRALTSIKAELRKRQRLFGEHEVNHINHYHKLRKEGKASEPMPHLFIISDEFAELKSEQPDFMKELVSTARIGRSLGIHLILATQKPSGVVDDQIWSNSKFKLALKVQDKQDSNEILKTPDAADITLPGRAYLQVGNNEIYELFQSAWSGAQYEEEGQKQPDSENKVIYLINEYGQLQPINKDLSGIEEDIPKETQTELEAVISHISDVTNKQKVLPVKRPWLPPLPENVYQVDMMEVDFRKLWSETMQPVTLTLGKKDVPEEQYQGPMKVELKKAGNIAVIGSPGYGRSTFLHNITFDIARHFRPDQAHLYLFDFGTNGLMPMIDVPHVADYFTVDQDEKIKKALKRLQGIIDERKKLLSQERVVNLDQYNQQTGRTLPNIFVMIDNYDAVKEVTFMEVFEEVMSKVTREGLALGIYTIITGSRTSTVKASILTNIKTRIALYLFDSSESTNVLGASKKGAKDIKGRAVISDDNFTQFQVAQPFKVDENDTLNNCIKNEIALMKKNYVNSYPKHIPMMPEHVLEKDIDELYNTKTMITNEYKIPLGLDFEEVELVSLDLTQPSIITALSPQDLEIVNNHVLNALKLLTEKETVILIDSDQSMHDKSNQVSLYYSTVEEQKFVKDSFSIEIKKRMSGEYSTEQRKIVMISNLKAFISNTMLTEQEVRMILAEGPKYNIFIIFSSMYNDIVSTYERQAKLVRQIVDQSIIVSRLYDQELVMKPSTSREPLLNPYEMYYTSHHQTQKIQLIEQEVT